MHTEQEYTNEERSALEIHEWCTNPPDRYCAYVSKDMSQITTWMGDTLGTIVWIGKRYRSNFGDTRQHFTVLGMNGRRYAGVWYPSTGDYCRLYAYKQHARAACK